MSTWITGQRREFHEALLDERLRGLAGKWQAAIVEVEQNRPKRGTSWRLGTAPCGALGGARDSESPTRRWMRVEAGV